MSIPAYRDGELLEATRATLIAHHPLPLAARAILWMFARPGRLAVALGAARVLRGTRIASRLSRLPGRFGFAMAMLASTTRRRSAPWYRSGGAPDTTATEVHHTDGSSRGRAAILRGRAWTACFATQIAPPRGPSAERDSRSSMYRTRGAAVRCTHMRVTSTVHASWRASMSRRLPARASRSSSAMPPVAAQCSSPTNTCSRTIRNMPSARRASLRPHAMSVKSSRRSLHWRRR